MLFSDIIGQETVKQHLRTMYINHRIPHAMLFVGQEGVGGLQLAYAFAQYINCTGDKSNGDSCGTCPSCIKYQKLGHPDFHMVFPTINKDKETNSDTYLAEWRDMFTETPYFTYQQWIDNMKGDKQASIRDADSTAIHRKLQMKPYEATYQILVLWYPELMNDTVSNKLLKILEEPPSDTLFMLVGENPSKLLPTIISRTQIINVPPIQENDICDYMISKYYLSEEKAQMVAHYAAGNLVRAIQTVTESEQNRENLDFFKNIMRSCYQKDIVAMNALSDFARKSITRETLKISLNYSLRIIRESFILNLNNSQLSYLTSEEKDFLLKFAPFVHINNVFDLSKLFNDAIAQVEQNGNVQIIIMDLLLNVAMLIRKQRP